MTQNYFLIALRSFLRYLNDNSLTALSPNQIELNKQESPSLKLLDNNNLHRLLAAPDLTKIDGIRDKAILEMLFSTGLRVSELTLLNRDQINLANRQFKVLGQGKKERIVFLSETAGLSLEIYLRVRKDSFKPLFIRFQGKVDSAEQGEKMRLSPRSIERIMEKYVKLAGVSIKATPHTLRHNFATNCLTNGATLATVQQQLGHLNISTTKVYKQLKSRQSKKYNAGDINLGLSGN